MQRRNRIAHHTRALLGTWPGLLTLGLVLCILSASALFFSRRGEDVSAYGPATVLRVPTLVPTHAPVVIVVPTRPPTATPSPTPRSTQTPTPTATPIANSPLRASAMISPAVISSAITTTVITTQVVPLPAELTGPQIVPVDVITATRPGIISASSTVTASVPLTPSTTLTETSEPTPTALPTATVDALALLVPTPTPTATQSIIEALEQPISGGGLGAIAATATALAPQTTDQTTDQTTGEAVSDAPTEEVNTEEANTEEVTAEEVSAPLPVATIASQPTPDGTARTVRVPILMYHYISVPPANADIYRIDLSVTPDLLAAHLDAIQQAGYTPITLYALFDHLMNGAPLPEKPMVLTFDDGYRDNYTNAFPLLRDRGMTATFFIVTDFIYDQRPEYVTWDMVREMYAGGMSIEGHGRNHVSLANKDRDYLIWQALGTYEAIEYEIGVRPRFISYPAGEYDQTTIDIFSSASYWAGFTTKQGATHSSDDLFQLRRIRVRGSTTSEELLRLLALDW